MKIHRPSPLQLSGAVTGLLPCVIAPALPPLPSTRRSVVLLLLCALYAVSCVSTSAHAGDLRHVVLFAFKDGTTPAQVAAIEAKFAGLPARIPQIVGFEWGTDVSVEDNADGFTHCFLVTFADTEGRAAYLPHPAHQEFIALLRPSLDKVLVLDYVARSRAGKPRPTHRDEP